jgi:hypothetical protein
MMQLPAAILAAFVAGGFCGNHDQVEKQAIEWASYDAGIAGLQHVSCVNTGLGIEPCRAFTAYTMPIVLVCTKDSCVHAGFTSDASENWDVKGAKYIPATKRTRIVPEP